MHVIAPAIPLRTCLISFETLSHIIAADSLYFLGTVAGLSTVP